MRHCSENQESSFAVRKFGGFNPSQKYRIDKTNSQKPSVWNPLSPHCPHHLLLNDDQYLTSARRPNSVSDASLPKPNSKWMAKPFTLLPKMTTGWWYTYPSEKYEFVNGKDDIPYIMENKKCLKPPIKKKIEPCSCRFVMKGKWRDSILRQLQSCI